MLRLSRSTIRSLVAPGLRDALARPAQRAALLVPGPDRAAHRAGAGAGERACAPHHALDARAARGPCPNRCRCPGSPSARSGTGRGPRRRRPLAGRHPASTSWSSRRSRQRRTARHRDTGGAGERRRRSWFERGADLEERDTGAAIAAYEKAVAADPRLLDALDQSRAGCCTIAVTSPGPSASTARPWPRAATMPCCSSISACCSRTWDRPTPRSPPTRVRCAAMPTWPTAHYNLALLFEKLKRPKDALRHMARYREADAEVNRYGFA